MRHAREGIEIDVSTLADRVGACVVPLDPIIGRRPDSIVPGAPKFSFPIYAVHSANVDEATLTSALNLGPLALNQPARNCPLVPVTNEARDK